MSDTGYTYGRMVWHDLMTRDEAKARAFYSGLFGWTYEDRGSADSGPYTRILLDGKPIGGMWQIQPDNPAPSVWMSYVSVPDVDETARRAVELGGRLARGPVDLPGIGRFAALLDFSGAPIIAFRSLTGDPPLGEPKPGEFCWESLGTPDVARAKEFYGQLFGWKTLKGREGTEGMFTTDGTERGQLADILVNKEYIPAWVPQVRVEKLGPLSDRVSELGGQVTALFMVPRVGRIAIAEDPARGQLGLFEPSRK